MQMKDIEEAKKFENGETDIFEVLLNMQEGKDFYASFGENGYEKIKAIYEFAFTDENEEVLKKVGLSSGDVGENLKEACVRRIGYRKGQLLL